MNKKDGAIVQIDDDPMERKDEAGRLRFSLNDRERKELTLRKNIARAVELLAADRDLPSIAEELGTSTAQLAHDMLYGESPEARDILLKRVIGKFLDLNRGYKRSEIAKELGMTTGQLDHLTRTDMFREKWAEEFVTLREDPNIQAVQKIVVEDLLPEALRTLKWELSVDAPATVRQGARRDVFKLAGVEAVQAEQSDRAAAAEFLQRHEVKIEDGKLQIPIPKEYLETMKSYLPDDVIDAEVVDAKDD